jgi:hypothetical protein
MSYAGSIGDAYRVIGVYAGRILFINLGADEVLQ